MVIPYLQTPDLSDLDRETKLEVMELTDLKHQEAGKRHNNFRW